MVHCEQCGINEAVAQVTLTTKAQSTHEMVLCDWCIPVPSEGETVVTRIMVDVWTQQEREIITLEHNRA